MFWLNDAVAYKPVAWCITTS